MEYSVIMTREDIQEFIDSDASDGNGWVEINSITYDEKNQSLKIYFNIRR